MDKVIRASFAAFDGIDAPDKVPTEIRLFSAGQNDYCDGTLLFDDQAAKSVMSRYTSRKLTLKADYEHQSLEKPPVIAPASAKKWVPEVRDGALYATQIQWTKKARQMIADGEYDYFSIAARVDPNTGRVVEMINFALTNTPAANGIEPLIAASAIKHTENDMKTVIVALGLRADAEEAEAIAAATSLKEFEREILTLAAKTDRAGAVGAITAMRAIVAEASAVKAELVALKKATVDTECKRLCDDATKDGRLPPAKRADMESMYAKFGLEAVTVALSMMPKIALSAEEGAKPLVAAPVTEGEFSVAELSIAKTMTGGDPTALAKHLEKLREAKRGKK